MGYFQVRYDYRVVNYDRKMFIRLVTVQIKEFSFQQANLLGSVLPRETHFEDCLDISVKNGPFSALLCLFLLFSIVFERKIVYFAGSKLRSSE